VANVAATARNPDLNLVTLDDVRTLTRHLPVLQSLGGEGVKSAGYALLVTYPKRENPDSGAVAVAMAQRSSAARYSVAPKPQLAATPAAPVSRPGKSEYRSPHCRLDKCGRSGTASLLAHAQPRREPKR
jgi:hypothetical protein